MRDKRWLMLVFAAVVVALDRWSKLWVEAHVKMGHAITLIPRVLRITHVLNTGAAFSMFEAANKPLLVRNMLVGFSLAAIVVVLTLLWKMGRTISVTSVALALILGGAVGNLYDRLMYKHVVDFIEVHIFSYHWPDFNVADSCIVIGACLLLLEMLFPRKANR